MRTVISETIAYEYSELSDAAKERVRYDNNAMWWEDYYTQESVRVYAENIVSRYMTVSSFGDLSYSLYTQGGEPLFSLKATIGNDVWLTVTNHPYYGMQVEYGAHEDDAQPEELAIFVRDLLHAIRSEISAMLYMADEYYSSDEYAAEMADANGYEYDEDGDMI